MGATGPSQPPSNSPFPDLRSSRAHACAVRVLNERLLCARFSSLSGGTEDFCRLWDRLWGIWEGLEPEGLPRGSAAHPGPCTRCPPALGSHITFSLPSHLFAPVPLPSLKATALPTARVTFHPSAAADLSE